MIDVLASLADSFLKVLMIYIIWDIWMWVGVILLAVTEGLINVYRLPSTHASGYCEWLESASARWLQNLVHTFWPIFWILILCGYFVRPRHTVGR